MEQAIHSPPNRVGAILVIDLVKYSSRSEATKQSVQKILEDCFSEAKNVLKLNGAQFSYTGDGYFCAFLGESSATVLDFINLAFPNITRLLAEHKQEFRAGLDFGLVREKRNTLTGTAELGGMPGIIATRLEQAAQPNSILCSETVQQVFASSYPEMFSTEKRSVETKDRSILAYDVRAFEVNFLAKAFLELVWPTQIDPDKLTGSKKRILVVDDEEWLLEMVELALRQRYPAFDIIRAMNGDEARDRYESGQWDIILTDINMDRVDGYQLTQSILRSNPEQKVILMSGLVDRAGIVFGYDIGAVHYFSKPFTVEQLYEDLERVMGCSLKRSDRDKLAALSDRPGEMFARIRSCSEIFASILAITKRSNDLASSMLRHKAKQIVRDFASRIRPGMDILIGLSTIMTQLTSLERLAKPSGNVRTGELRSFLKDFYADLGENHSNIKFILSWKNFQADKMGSLSEPVILLIISELIDNAVFALNGLGVIETTISHLKSSNSLRILVRDSGPGIPADLRDRIFNEGTSSKGEGRGLGLWLIREALRTLKGDITYNYNKGAEFSVRIPLSA